MLPPIPSTLVCATQGAGHGRDEGRVAGNKPAAGRVLKGHEGVGWTLGGCDDKKSCNLSAYKDRHGGRLGKSTTTSHCSLSGVPLFLATRSRRRM